MATKEEEKKFQYTPYQESEAVKQAQAMLQQQLQQKPGAYQSQWQTQLNETMDKILNREKFSYDLNGDALYDQYKDKFITQGKMAMMDTMGQAQAMTGGYGNSYAQTAGQQTYQGHLNQLNDVIPELYQLALSRYQMEGDNMNNRLALLQEQENLDYGRHQDAMNAWLTERDYLTGRYDSERNYDYGMYGDNRDFTYNQFLADRDFAFQQEQAALEQQRWQAEFDEARRQWEAAQAKSSSRSSGGGGSSSSKKTAGSEASGGTETDVLKEAVQAMTSASSYGKGNQAMTSVLNTYKNNGTINQAQWDSIYEAVNETVRPRPHNYKPNLV